MNDKLKCVTHVKELNQFESVILLQEEDILAIEFKDGKIVIDADFETKSMLVYAMQHVVVS